MDIQATTLSVDNIEAKNLKIDGTSFAAKASASTLGGVKINGNNLAITSDGTLSASGGSYELPQANINQLGGVKVYSSEQDSAIVISEDGILSCKSATPDGCYGVVKADGTYGVLATDDGNLSVAEIPVTVEDSKVLPRDNMALSSNTIYVEKLKSSQFENYDLEPMVIDIDGNLYVVYGCQYYAQ